jgi:hypothetical protein
MHQRGCFQIRIVVKPPQCTKSSTVLGGSSHRGLGDGFQQDNVRFCRDRVPNLRERHPERASFATLLGVDPIGIGSETALETP